MANEMVQGLLQNLLQPTQGPSPADIMAAISSRNPMASVAAMQAPQLSQMFGQQFRGLVGGLTGRPAPLTANEAYTAAVQQLSAQPDFMNSSASLAQLAKAASAVGRTQEAMQFSLLASQAREQEAAKAKLEAEKNKGLTMQSLARNTNIAAVDQAIASIPDATKYPGLSNALEGLRNQYATESEPSSPDKVQSTISGMFTRAKVDQPTATSGMTPSQLADLYKSFTPASIQAFRADPNAALVPLSKPEDQDELTMNQMATLQEKFTPESVQAFRNNPSAPLILRPDAGGLSPSVLSTMYTQFTPESVEAFKADHNAVLVPRPERAKDITPAEQITMLNTAINSVPTYSKTGENLAQLAQVKDLLPLLGTNNPQAYTVISAVVSQLVGSNARAQAEIEAFRSEKGIRESIGDYVKRVAGTTPTKETQDNIQEIINILDANFQAQRQREIDQVVSNYEGVIDPERLNTWKANLMRSLTSDDIESIVAKNISGE